MNESPLESISRTILRENEAKFFLKEHGIPTTRFVVIGREDSPQSVKLPFPLVAKICAREIIHKTEVQGVILNIKNSRELLEAVQELRNKFPGQAILVETMERGNVELIMGMIRDSIFGPTIMLGLGGVLAELYKDVTFRTIPVDEYDAEEMISELRGSKLLEGYRGIRVDRESIKDLLLKVSNIGEGMGERLEQLDLNPVIASEGGVVVVDAKIILRN
ncbi:MAG: acetate--CoA ligase family protein [Thermoplasmata archaeon]